MQILEYISYIIVPLIFIGIIVSCSRKKVKAYDTFLEGVGDGFDIVKNIFPTMLAVVVAINVFKVSGAMDLFIKVVSPVSKIFGIPTEIVPIGIMRSVSGGGSLAILSDILATHGPDSIIGRIASVIMGSSDTTLFVLAMYTSTIKINKTKSALIVGLLSDFIAIVVTCHICKFI